jgi:adenylate cyclase
MIARLLGFLASRPQLVRLLLPISLAFFMGILSFTSVWESLELKGFDMLTRLTATEKPSVPVVIVAIDEASFGNLEKQWPWPRGMHAKVVDALREDGAKVIAFDMEFSEPDSHGKDQDQELADAISRAGNVVLGANISYSEREHFKSVSRIDPLHIFKAAGARSALIAVNQDPDSAQRRLPEYEDSFFREIIREYSRHTQGIPTDIRIPPGSMIRYVGPDHTFKFVSYYQVIEHLLPKGTFKDQIVMIGRDVTTAPEVGAQQVDMFITPFFSSTRQLMPGVEIHANMIDGTLTRRNLIGMPWVSYLTLTVLMTLLAGLAMREWLPVRSLVVVLGFALVLLFASWVLFEYANYWIQIASPIAGMLLVYIANGGIAFLREQQRRQEIKRAWSFYVSPQVVDLMIAHPEQLVLGGQKRVVTLMFTDLAGFTSISEKLTPEQVSHLLNRHLTEMTRIVIAHGGTVNKFIGDALMAFWGAPLDDPDQAKHACEAARDMQTKMEGLRDELEAEGLPRVFMRVGLHTGPAVVGNMGSDERFDYTALGDTVNLASRLEGANKEYGTDILLSEATARGLNGALMLRVVDNVKVKGKLEPVEVFTIDDDEEVGRLTEKGVNAFRAKRWDESASFWQALLMRRKQDSLAILYLERIAAFRASPPAADWDGAIALDSK